MSSVPLPAPPLRREAVLIGLIGLVHGMSHFSQLLLPPLFPWLKDAFGVGYAQLGFLLTIFFVVSCATQTAAGFLVDRVGPRPVLYGGLSLIVVAAFGFASSTAYWMLAAWAVVAGLGNGVFHPVDYTVLNRKVSKPRLGHAYSVHGITGSLGWALAPALLVPVAIASSWRVALMTAGGVVFAVLLLALWRRDELAVEPAHRQTAAAGAAPEPTFAFLRIPAVWLCFTFFFFFAMVLSTVQAFAPEAARRLHDVPVAWVATCLSAYMVCSALGMVGGGFLAADPARAEKVVAAGVGCAAIVALTLGFADLPAAAVPVLFGLMGLFAGTAGPSRDMIVKRSTPENASGRVFGVVYSGLDIGQAIAPLFFGALMDRHQDRAVFLGLAVVQGLLIASAFNVKRGRRAATIAA